ncbi:MAG: ATP synthase F0 subunit C [Proteobacteria bacterium]|nr:ATP synthase F0 subunit C [Pseudomonadota bacterium]
MFKRILSMVLVAFCSMMVSAPVAMAAEEGGGDYTTILTVIMATAGITMAVAAVGAASAMGGVVRGSVESVARNPSAAGKVLTTMMIGLAMIESLAIYALVVALLLLFVSVGHFI